MKMQFTPSVVFFIRIRLTRLAVNIITFIAAHIIIPLLLSAWALALQMLRVSSLRRPTPEAMLDVLAVWLENIVALIALGALAERLLVAPPNLALQNIIALRGVLATATVLLSLTMLSVIVSVSWVDYPWLCGVPMHIASFAASLWLAFKFAPRCGVGLVFLRRSLPVACAIVVSLSLPCAVLVGDLGVWAPLTSRWLNFFEMDGEADTFPHQVTRFVHRHTVHKGNWSKPTGEFKVENDLPIGSDNDDDRGIVPIQEPIQSNLFVLENCIAEEPRSKSESSTVSSKLTKTAYGRPTLKQVARFTKTRRRTKPNVIMVVHESLAGYALYSTEGKKYAPFLHENFFQRDDVFPFVHTGFNAGSSEAATAPLMSGVAPLTDCGMRMQRNFSIVDEMRDDGYTTALYSAYNLVDVLDTFENLNHLLTTGFHTVVAPETINVRIITHKGMHDDALMESAFEYIRRLKHQQQTRGSRPFYLQIILNHLHAPGLLDPQDRFIINKDRRYFRSLKMMDRFYKKLMEVLTETGFADNTIIGSSGDHGEAPTEFDRLSFPSAVSIATFMSFRVPEALWRSPKDKATLRINTQRRVTTLDFLPTLRSILVAMPSNGTLFSQDERDHNLVGRSLIMEEMPVNRQVHTWFGPPLRDGISHAMFYNGTYNTFSLHTNKPWGTREVLMAYNPDSPFDAVRETHARDLPDEQIARWSKIIFAAHPRLLDRMAFVMKDRSLWYPPKKPHQVSFVSIACVLLAVGSLALMLRKRKQSKSVGNGNRQLNI